jgi:hypothetical protein
MGRNPFQVDHLFLFSVFQVLERILTFNFQRCPKDVAWKYFRDGSYDGKERRLSGSSAPHWASKIVRASKTISDSN